MDATTPLLRLAVKAQRYREDFDPADIGVSSLGTHGTLRVTFNTTGEFGTGSPAAAVAAAGTDDWQITNDPDAGETTVALHYDFTEDNAATDSGADFQSDGELTVDLDEITSEQWGDSDAL